VCKLKKKILILILTLSVFLPASICKGSSESADETTIGKLSSMSLVSLEEQVKNWIDYQISMEQAHRSKMQSEFIYKKNTIEVDTRKEWFLEYKRLREEYSEWLNLRPTIYDNYTENEIYLMQRCVETECYQRSFDNKVNVASVIFNRIEHPGFPNNPTEVITTYRQFAYIKTEISEDTVLALEYAFLFNELSPGILFFHSKEWSETFCGAKYSFSDDAVHHFYEIN